MSTQCLGRMSLTAVVSSFAVGMYSVQICLCVCVCSCISYCAYVDTAGYWLTELITITALSRGSVRAKEAKLVRCSTVGGDFGA